MNDVVKADLIQRASNYGIKEEQVRISVHTTVDNNNDIEMVKSIYDKMDTEVEKRNTEIIRLQREVTHLQQELAATKRTTLPYTQITREISGIYPMVKSVIIGQGAKISVDSLQSQSCISVILQSTRMKPCTTHRSKDQIR